MSASELVAIIGLNPIVRLDKALARDVPEVANSSRSRLVEILLAGAISRAGTVMDDQTAQSVPS